MQCKYMCMEVHSFRLQGMLKKYTELCMCSLVFILNKIVKRQVSLLSDQAHQGEMHYRGSGHRQGVLSSQSSAITTYGARPSMCSFSLFMLCQERVLKTST